MLSKEEVRSILNKCDTCKLTECIGCDITYTERNKIREYIEQLETDKQKLIEKLKEIINDDEMSDVEYQMKRELAQVISEYIINEEDTK